jgi:hypothetical protein
MSASRTMTHEPRKRSIGASRDAREQAERSPEFSTLRFIFHTDRA